MVKLGFKGPLAKSLGLRELEVEGGSLGEVLKRDSLSASEWKSPERGTESTW